MGKDAGIFTPDGALVPNPRLLGVKTERLFRIDPTKHPLNLLQDLSALVRFVDSSVDPHPELASSIDPRFCISLGDQYVGTRQRLDRTTSAIRLVPVGPNGPDGANNIMITYLRSDTTDRVIVPHIVYAKKITTDSDSQIEHTTMLYEEPNNLRRYIRLDWKRTHGGKDCLDPKRLAALGF